MSADAILAMPDLLRTIWTRPRMTMRWVLDHGDGGLWAWLLAAEAAVPLLPIGILVLVDASRPADTGFYRSFLGFTAGLFAGFLATWLGAILAVGRILAGRWATGDALRAVAWGLVPIASALPLAPFAGISAFGGSMPGGPFFQLLIAGAAAWSFGLVSCTLAEAHRVSTPRGLTIVLVGSTLTLVLALVALFTWITTDPGFKN